MLEKSSLQFYHARREVEKEEQLVKTLVEKKAELKELQAEKAQLEAVEAKKQSPKEEMKVTAVESSTDFG